MVFLLKKKDPHPSITPWPLLESLPAVKGEGRATPDTIRSADDTFNRRSFARLGISVSFGDHSADDSSVLVLGDVLTAELKQLNLEKADKMNQLLHKQPSKGRKRTRRHLPQK